jgi:hypothetical protein
MHKLRFIWKKIKVEINEFKNWLIRLKDKYIKWLLKDLHK